MRMSSTIFLHHGKPSTTRSKCLHHSSEDEDNSMGARRYRYRPEGKIKLSYGKPLRPGATGISHVSRLAWRSTQLWKEWTGLCSSPTERDEQDEQQTPLLARRTPGSTNLWAHRTEQSPRRRCVWRSRRWWLPETATESA